MCEWTNGKFIGAVLLLYNVFLFSPLFNIMKKTFLFVLLLAGLLLSFITSKAQPHFDVLNYTFHITLNDKNDSIIGLAQIRIMATDTFSLFQFDLANIDKKGKGMLVYDAGSPYKTRNSRKWSHE